MEEPAKSGLDPELKEVLRDTLDAMDRLLSLFRLERALHLIVGVIGFLLLIYAIVLLLVQDSASTQLLVSLFGAGGLIAVSSARITYFFNQAFQLVEHIVRTLIRTDESHG